MKCARMSSQNQWRNMGRTAASRGYRLDEYIKSITSDAARDLFTAGYEEHIAKMSRAAIRAGKDTAKVNA